MQSKTYEESQAVMFAVHECTIKVDGYPWSLALLVKQLKRRESTCESSCLHGGANSALCVKPFRNLEIKNLPKLLPWLPFYRARIISDANIWMLFPLQFHFQFLFGDELKTVSCYSQIAKESVASQTGCGKDVNKFEGTS